MIVRARDALSGPAITSGSRHNFIASGTHRQQVFQLVEAAATASPPCAAANSTKSSTRANRSPTDALSLTPEQLTYAALDVEVLVPLYVLFKNLQPELALPTWRRLRSDVALCGNEHRWRAALQPNPSWRRSAT